MDYSVWRSVLLDWVNSTGFLVKNHENLNDTNINEFFYGLKIQITSVSIKSSDVISFLGDYYKDFLVKTTEGQNIPCSEYVYIYSIFLHFSCILYSDHRMQNICKNMIQKNQELIEKFLQCLIRTNKCDRAILQNAIEEAELCETFDYKSPTNKQIQSLLSSTSPQTPKTKLLESWNLENRNLKAQLETEGFERGFLEMQLSQCEKKLSKLDEKYREILNENNNLRKHILMLGEQTSDNQENTSSNHVVKQLQRDLNDKENELVQLTSNWNASLEEINDLKEKLNLSQTQLKTLGEKVLLSHDEIEKYKVELEQREKMIDYVNNNNRELSELLKELQSSTRKNDRDSSASCDMLELTAADLNTSSFSVPNEENLASEVVDIRLIDQQKQNIALKESVQRLQNELSAMQSDALKLFSSMFGSRANGVETPSFGRILTDIHDKCTNLMEDNQKLSEDVETNGVRMVAMLKEEEIRFKAQLEENETTINALQIKIDSMNEKMISMTKANEEFMGMHQSVQVELETTKASLAACEDKRSELEAMLGGLKEELEQAKSEKREEASKHFNELRMVNSEHETKLKSLQATLDIYIKEEAAHKIKLESVQEELKQTKSDLDKKSSELASATKLKLNLQKSLKEIERKYTDVVDKYEKGQTELLTVRKNSNALKRDAEKYAKLNTELSGRLENIEKESKNKIADVEAERHLKREISNLKATVKELNDKHNEHDKNKSMGTQNPSKEIAMVKNALQEIGDQITEFRAQKSILNEQLVSTEEQVRIEFERANTEKQQLGEEIKQLEVKLTEATTQVAEMQTKKEIMEIKENIDVLKMENESLSAKVNELQVENKKMSNEIAETDDALEKANIVALELNAQKELLMDKSSKLVEIAEKRHTELLLICEARANQCKRYEGVIRQKVTKLVEEAKKITELQSERETLKQKIEQLSSESIKQRYANEDLKKENESLFAVIYELKVEQKNVSSEIAMTKDDLQKANDQIAELNSQKAMLDETIASTEKQLTEIREELETVNAEKNSLVTKVIQLNRTIDELKQQSSAEIKELEEKLVEEATKVTEIQSEKETMKQTIEQLTSESVNHRNANEVLKKENESLSAKVDELSVEKEKVSNEIAMAKDEMQKANDQIAELNSQKAILDEKIESTEKQLTDIRKEFETANTGKQQLGEEIKQFEVKLTEATTQVAEMRTEKETMAQTIEQLKSESVNHQNANEILKKENESLSAKVDDYSHEIEKAKVTLSNLEDENKRLIESASSKNEVQALKDQINHIQKQYQQQCDNWKKEKESHIQDIKIYRAKLIKERETIEQKEKEHKETRQEYEIKLEKMKEKMKSLYKEEMAKAKEKNEKELGELLAKLTTENKRCLEKIAMYEAKFKKYAVQIHRLNDEKLELLKTNEVMKTKLRSMNINLQLNPTSTTNLFEGHNFKMEDEEGEFFDNTYLDELRSGSDRIGLDGRDSLTLDEINRRNSMVPPHLRSSYMPQFANTAGGSRGNENMRVLDDSMFSTQSESRRSTVYRRPGPPTPSKNGGRLSLGGNGDLPRDDILREQNSNERKSIGGGGTMKAAAKKATPGKFRSMFTTSKMKDEEKENDQILLEKLLFSTSTPNRRSHRRSSLPRFDSGNFVGSTDGSISRFDPKLSFVRFDPKLSIVNFDAKYSSELLPYETVARNQFTEVKDSARKTQWSFDAETSISDSTPESGRRNPDLSKRKSWSRKRRSSMVAKKASRFNSRKEKRHAIYNQLRRISNLEPVEHAIDETFSIAASTVQSVGTNFGSEYEENKIRKFQAEINEHNGPLDISIGNIEADSIEEQNNFERLCNNKKSYSPFDQLESIAEKPLERVDKNVDKKTVNRNANESISNQLKASFGRSSGRVVRISNHCARMCWNQQKIPQLVKFKAEKRNESVENRSSISSTHSSLLTNVTTLHRSVSEAWHELPTFVQYYMVAITLCFISIVHYQFSK